MLRIQSFLRSYIIFANWGLFFIFSIYYLSKWNKTKAVFVFLYKKTLTFKLWSMCSLSKKHRKLRKIRMRWTIFLFLPVSNYRQRSSERGNRAPKRVNILCDTSRCDTSALKGELWTRRWVEWRRVVSSSRSYSLIYWRRTTDSNKVPVPNKV